MAQAWVVGDAHPTKASRLKWIPGRQDLLWVSNLQTGQLTTEADLIKARGLQRVNRIRLLLALGGSFDPAPAMIPPDR